MELKEKHELKKYLYSALTLFVGISLSVLFFFVIFRLPEIGGRIGKLFNILTPFVYGGIIAYLLVPVCNFLERGICRVTKVVPDSSGRAMKIIRAVSVFLGLVVAVLVIYILVALVIPQVRETGENVIALFEGAPEIYNDFIMWLTKLFEDNPEITDYVGQYSGQVYDYLMNWIQHLIPNITNVIGGVSSGVINVVNVVKNLFIGIIVAIYLLLARKRFAKQANMLVYSMFKKPAADKIVEEVHFVDKAFSGFINGRLLDSAIIGLLCYVCCRLMRMPYPFLISVIVGVTNMIPFFGPFIGAVPSAFIILLVSPLKCLYFIIFIIILQQVDGNIIGPKIMGNSTGLSSFWVLFAITLFGGWFGFVGMIIGVPLFAVIYHLVCELVNLGLEKHGQENMLINYLWQYNPQEAGAYEEYRRKKAGQKKDSGDCVKDGERGASEEVADAVSGDQPCPMPEKVVSAEEAEAVSEE